MALKDDLKEQFAPTVHIQEFGSTLFYERCVAIGIAETHRIQRRREWKEVLTIIRKRIRNATMKRLSNATWRLRGRISDWIAPDGWNDE